jgi:membrane protease YdiL (CAAX protease family)
MAGRRRVASRSRWLFYSASLLLAALVIAPQFLAAYSYIGAVEASVISTLALSFLFSSMVVSYLLMKRRSLRGIIGELGLSMDRLTPINLLYGVAMFLSYLAMILIIAAASSLLGLNLSSNVAQTLHGFPLYALAFAALIAPINEEILFRGFMVPRIGIVLSALVFSLFHLSYGSWIEFGATLWFGLVAGYAFKRTRSLYPSILTHMLVNTLTVILLVYGGALAMAVL